jgi:hypothetical protein
MPAIFIFIFVALKVARFFGHVPALLSSDNFYGILVLALCCLYLFPAMRRVYAQGRLTTLFKCILLLTSLVFILQTYRFILFFTTLYSI